MTRPDWRRQKTQTFDPHVLAGAFVDRRIPETEMQALMEADFGDEPEESWDEKHERFTVIHDAIEQVLDERERYVVEAKFWRGMGLDLTAREMGLSKTHVKRIRNSAMQKLAEVLGEELGFDEAED